MVEMFTGMNILIRAQDLTHEFVWKRKVIPIGRFDPSAYPEMKEVDIEDLGQEIFDQLDDSRRLTNKEMEEIVSLSKKEFNSCIKERK